jgi:transposase
MDKRQAAALAGLAPITRQSGTWTGKSFIGGGRSILRKALYMPALVAARFNKYLKAKYDGLIIRGKPAKIALTGIMRNIIVIANALIRDNRLWNQNMV